MIHIPLDKCPITNVTVYNDRVEIIRNVQIELNSGNIFYLHK